MASLSERAQRLSSGGKDAAEIRASFKNTASNGAVIDDEQPWTPSSWTLKPIKQDVIYDNREQVEAALAKLERLPPLVTPTEICKLQSSLREVALGRAFLLQGGDCAELFDYCEESSIDSKVKLLLQMSLVLTYGGRKPVVRVARMAGQYAKPRSSATEVIDGQEIPSFRGDILNGYDIAERRLDPSRLVLAYYHSASTLNYIRAQLASGIADLHRSLDWNLGHVKDKTLQRRYQTIVNSITESLDFMHTIGADTSAQLETVDLYTSHEALLLEYEQSLTRKLLPPTHLGRGYSSLRSDKNSEHASKAWYNTSAHFIWIGDRTRQLDGAHVEYFRGIANPIGIKVGPTMEPDELVNLLNIVDPDRQTGKVTLITRYGVQKIHAKLGAHINAVKSSGHVVVWQCDPMHGNTKTTSGGVKTRQFLDILNEVSSALQIHKEHSSFLGGVHLELTGDAVTECTGGSEGLDENDLSLNYTTYCDPRLNEKQALELAFLVASHYRGDTSNEIPQDMT
ncbi:MAG: Aromatic/aminoadipate aminotransferase 1 [Chrysothrix sp. TS-e1954]|nr:MAG: Aromatic/aminoadipate aminotransferase 1 [Chrysothrix sp. TS-e1954]